MEPKGRLGLSNEPGVTLWGDALCKGKGWHSKMSVYMKDWFGGRNDMLHYLRTAWSMKTGTPTTR